MIDGANWDGVPRSSGGTRHGQMRLRNRDDVGGNADEIAVIEKQRIRIKSVVDDINAKNASASASQAAGETKSDVVEISDVARVLSQATKELAEAEKAMDAERNGTRTTAKAETSVSATATGIKATATKTASNVSAIGTAESRAEQAKDYNAILADLRKNYSEQEAMHRFDEIMKADGFEVRKGDGNGNLFEPFVAKVGGGNWATASGGKDLVGSLALRSSNPGVYDLLGGTKEFSQRDLTTYSTLAGYMVNGQEKFAAATYTVFTASYGNHGDAAKAWTNRDYSDLSAQSGIDIDSFLTSAFGERNQFAADGVSADLATIANNLLKKAGVTLKEGQSLVFSLTKDENGNDALAFNVNGMRGDDPAWERLAKTVDAEIEKNPSIVKAFVAQGNSVPRQNVQDIDGHFTDGDRFVKYTQTRQFVLSASNPNAVVIGDRLDVQNIGYAYIRKDSDSFDLNADIQTVRGTNGASFKTGQPIKSLWETEEERANVAEFTNRIRERLEEARKNGTTIEANISEKEYRALLDKEQAARQGGYTIQNEDGSWSHGEPSGSASGQKEFEGIEARAKAEADAKAEQKAKADAEKVKAESDAAKKAKDEAKTAYEATTGKSYDKATTQQKEVFKFIQSFMTRGFYIDGNMLTKLFENLDQFYSTKN